MKRLLKFERRFCVEFSMKQVTNWNWNIIYQPQNNNTIYTKHHDKNTQQLLKNRTLKKVKTIHATSFGPKHQPTDMILNTLHRIYTNCSSKKLLFKSTLEYFYSQTFIGYKYQHFKKALYHISNSTNKLIWKKFLKKFKTQYKKSRSFRKFFGLHKLKPYYKILWQIIEIPILNISMITIFMTNIIYYSNILKENLGLLLQDEVWKFIVFSWFS